MQKENCSCRSRGSIHPFFPLPVSGYSKLVVLCENLSQFYKARVSFVELMTLPAGILSQLYHDFVKIATSEEGKKAAAASEVQDTMEGI